MAPFRTFLHDPDPENRPYDSEGFDELTRYSHWAWRWIFTIGGAIIAIGVGVALLSHDFSFVVFSMMLALFLSPIVAMIFDHKYVRLVDAHELRVADNKFRYARGLENAVHGAHDTLKEATVNIATQTQLMHDLHRAQRTGDIIISGNYAPVIIDSTLTNSYNTISRSDPDLAAAIKTLGGFIENSGNKEAGEHFRELHAQLAQSRPNRTILRALWSGIVAALPQVNTLTEIVSKIVAVFA